MPHETPESDYFNGLLDEMARTVENFAKYGDHCFDDAKAFFDSLTLAELNDVWPKNDAYPFQPIHYAANWSQVRISKMLIDRGVDIHKAVTVCTNSFEITRMMIAAGAADEELRELLLNAAVGIAATSVPDEHYKIIMHLLERGVRPDFADPAILQQWTQGMDQIFGKRILKFLLRVMDFPISISIGMRKRLSEPQR